MLSANYLESLPDQIVALYLEFENSVIMDVARRLAGLDYATETASWMVQRLSESGMLYGDILKQLATLTGKSDKELRSMFSKAGVNAVKFDDAVYKAAGLEPLPLNLSPAMVQVLNAGVQKTADIMRNLTLTTAIDAKNVFIQAADLAYMQVSNGAFDYISAIKTAVKQVANNGLSVVDYKTGHKDKIDVAMRRTVLTGVSQTAAKLSEARAEEMGCDLVIVSAHAGARNKGTGPENHESWQGGIYSRSGSDPKYKPFVETTGYGTGEGLAGWNCGHSFGPYFEGISERIYSDEELEDYHNQTVKYNGQEISVYDATQQQRAIERKIRYWKRQLNAQRAAGIPDQELSWEIAHLKNWQWNMRDFIKQMNENYKGKGLDGNNIKWLRQPEREQV